MQLHPNHHETIIEQRFLKYNPQSHPPPPTHIHLQITEKSRWNCFIQRLLFLLPVLQKWSTGVRYRSKGWTKNLLGQYPFRRFQHFPPCHQMCKWILQRAQPHKWRNLKVQLSLYWVQAYLVLLHLTSVAFFGKWRQDHPPSKTTTHFIMVVWKRIHNISKLCLYSCPNSFSPHFRSPSLGFKGGHIKKVVQQRYLS